MPVSTHKNATWKIQWYPVANMNIRESFVKLLGRLAHLAIQEMKKKQELSGSIQLCQRTKSAEIFTSSWSMVVEKSKWGHTDHIFPTTN